MSFVYGDPVYERREIVWDRLSQISLTRQGPWFMIGDFNEMIGNNEKRGGRRRAESSFFPFRNMLNNCGMIEFPHKGNFLSWVGYRSSGKVQCRLDRAVGNADWHQSFSHTNVEYRKLWGSDHRPVLARISSQVIKAKRNFKFDKRWVGKEGFKPTIERGWCIPSDPEQNAIHSKILTCRRAISSWKKTSQTNSQKKIETIKEQLEKAQVDDNTTNEELLKLKWDLCEAFREEELFWKQKSRANWLKEGDSNTRFFHATTKQRRARNRVTKLKRRDGTWAETEESIEKVATEYFQELFTSSQPTDFDDALRYITAQVTPEINQALTKFPSNEEIKQAINAINPDKAPGPDGMTSCFFQSFWDITAKDIIEMVKEFFTSNSLDSRLNCTNICLIPKTERPREMAEFRPISLCNVSYKIISKILCKRLKRFLPKLISETQSAFVARRLITDNILIAQEAFHALRTNPSCKSKFIAIKTDMSKAYDRVEWTFLEALMLKMGFSETWVSWIRSCISSVTYQVLLNGEAKGHIQPSRGLRQGDPLSPFLFIILTEALISQIRGAEAEGRLTGMKIARNSPPISHLLFADDSLFFCKADAMQCGELMKIIETYGRASGQQLNTSKSSIFFGKKVPPDIRNELKRTMGITKEGGMGTYLGLPENISGSKKKVFAFIQDRLSKRINSWSKKLLSKGGKEVMIKSVAQALPTYVMSCFLLPQETINKLQGAISKFWWSTKQNNRGLHWIAWEKICLPIDQGGLGYRDLKDFNLALLAKQLWRIIHFPSSFLARILKGRYFWYSNPLEVSKANSPSYGWTSMLAARDLLKAGLRKSIGSGANTAVWRDHWLPVCPPRPPACQGGYKDPYLLVYHLINPHTKEWRTDLLRQLFTDEDVRWIQCIKPSRSSQADRLVWAYTKSGSYTVKSGYDLASQLKELDRPFQVLEPSTTRLKQQAWKTQTTKKLKHFIWQCLTGCVAVRDRLVNRPCGTDRSCPRCMNPAETVNHGSYSSVGII